MSSGNGIKRVYFVGAGFSAGLGYPPGVRLIPTILRFLCGFNARGRKISKKHPLSKESCSEAAIDAVRDGIDRVLRQCFGVTKKLSAVTSVDQLDALLTGVDLAEFFTVLLGFSRNEAPFVNGRLKWEQLRESAAEDDFRLPSNLYDALASVVRSYFLEISEATDSFDSETSFGSLFEKVDPTKHALVNYNWDESIDYHLDMSTDQGFAYTYREWLDYSYQDGKLDEDMYLLLKPHGSIGWYDVGQGLSNDDLQFVALGDSRIARDRRRLVYFTEDELPVDLDGERHHPLNCPPAITPPTYAKSFEYEELRFIWQDVIDVCSHATEFVFLGYSLPPDDFWTRAAVRMALSSRNGKKDLRVVVISRSLTPPLLKNYQAVFGNKFTEQKNFIACDFGADGNESLGDDLEKKLKKAKIV